MKKFFLKSKIGIALAAVAVLFLGLSAYFFFSKPKIVEDTFTVAKGVVVQEVLVSGRVKAAESVDLAFESAGRIRSVNASIGDRVRAGQTLASLENGSAYANLLQAKADLSAEEAVLLDMKNGASPEDLAVFLAKVRSSELSLEDARQNLSDKIKDAYTKGDDAVRNKSYQFFSNPRSSTPIFIISSPNTALVNSLQEEVRNAEAALAALGEISSGVSARSDLQKAVGETRNYLGQLAKFADDLALVINSLEPSSGVSSATLNTYKSDVSTARVNINTAIANLSAAAEKWRDAESALLVAERNLEQEKAGSTREEILAEEARVEKYEANLEKAEAEYLRTIIRAPFDGVVTAKDGSAGEIVESSDPIVSVISVSKFQIEANVPEADVINLEKGDEAKVILDAYGKEETFRAFVVSISQSERIIDGVPTYKIVLEFSESDPKIKSGMSADMDIVTDERENVLFVPQRAVLLEGEKKYVRKVSGNSYEKIEVQTGIEGSLGDVEITEGLREGDKIILLLK